VLSRPNRRPKIVIEQRRPMYIHYVGPWPKILFRPPVIPVAVENHTLTFSFFVKNASEAFKKPLALSSLSLLYVSARDKVICLTAAFPFCTIYRLAFCVGCTKIFIKIRRRFFKKNSIRISDNLLTKNLFSL
jgi:hypothetical protein